jgi:hypothetical protein
MRSRNSNLQRNSQRNQLRNSQSPPNPSETRRDIKESSKTMNVNPGTKTTRPPKLHTTNSDPREKLLKNSVMRIENINPSKTSSPEETTTTEEERTEATKVNGMLLETTDHQEVTKEINSKETDTTTETKHPEESSHPTIISITHLITPHITPSQGMWRMKTTPESESSARSHRIKISTIRPGTTTLKIPRRLHPRRIPTSLSGNLPTNRTPSPKPRELNPHSKEEVTLRERLLSQE